MRVSRDALLVLVTSGSYYVAQWMAIALLPLMAIEHSNAPEQILFVVGCRTAPRLLFAPLGAWLISAFGARATASSFFLLSALITCHLLQSSTRADLLISSTCLGVVDIVASPALLLLRSTLATEEGTFRLNAIFQGLERVAKITGPGLTAAVVLLAGLELAVASVSFFFAVCAIFCWGIRKEDTPRNQIEPCEKERPRLLGVINAVLKNPTVRSITLPAILYGVPFGAMTPFFLWLVTSRIHVAASNWTFLLTAQGLGALVGSALISAGFVKASTTRGTLLLFVFSSALESGVFLLFLIAHSVTFSALVSFMAGIPEIGAYVTYLTLVQALLEKEHQGQFYALTMGLFDIAVLLGLLICYFCEASSGSFPLCWFTVCLFGVIPVFPAAFLAASEFGHTITLRRTS